MDKLLKKFIDTCKEQDEWIKEYYEKDSSDNAVCNAWKKVPLKLIPEVDIDIIHRFSDRNCTSKCTMQSSDIELADGCTEYICNSDIEIYDNSEGIRGDWEIYGSEIGKYFTDSESSCQYIKIFKGIDSEYLWINAWSEFVLDD